MMRLILFLTAVAVLFASQIPEMAPVYLAAGHPIDVPLMVIAGASLFSGSDSSILSALRRVYKYDDTPPPDEEADEQEPRAQPGVSEPDDEETASVTEPLETAQEKMTSWTAPWASSDGDTPPLPNEAEEIFTDEGVKGEEAADRQPRPPHDVPAGPSKWQAEPSEIPVESLAGGLLGALGFLYRGPTPREIPVEELVDGVVNVLGYRGPNPSEIPVETLEQGIFSLLGKGLAVVVDMSKSVGSSIMSEMRAGVRTIMSATTATFVTAELRTGIRTLASGTTETFVTLREFVGRLRGKGKEAGEKTATTY